MICVNFGSLSFKNEQQPGVHVCTVAGSVPEHSGESEVKESTTDFPGTSLMCITASSG
jgi:hypothetical protein